MAMGKPGDAHGLVVVAVSISETTMEKRRQKLILPYAKI
jgi:hypothetical protein